ncbi:MAG: mannose-1-phosphate guanylyltransferase [Pirellulaceae bacterium]
MIHAVIMAGGSGTRFWPASRSKTPKQLLRLAGDTVMLQATVDRLGDLVTNEQVFVLTNQRLVPAIRELLPDLPDANIVGEPYKRDTAPCIGLAASLVYASDPNAVMAVMPSDHVITPEATFQKALQTAASLVNDDPRRIITFGIPPTYPAESFGYIQRSDSIETNDGISNAYRVEQFKEKPSADIAQQYLDAGAFYWNSGIFVWKASTILEALRQFQPEMMMHIDNIAATIGDPSFESVLATEFEQINGTSIDYAVMEHYEHVVVLEATFHWDDVGSWQSLSRTNEQDDSGNTVLGKHLSIESAGNIISAEGDHLIATIGVNDKIIVHTNNATLVADKSEEERVREIVKQLEELEWDEYL